MRRLLWLSEVRKAQWVLSWRQLSIKFRSPTRKSWPPIPILWRTCSLNYMWYCFVLYCALYFICAGYFKYILFVLYYIHWPLNLMGCNFNDFRCKNILNASELLTTFVSDRARAKNMGKEAVASKTSALKNAVSLIILQSSLTHVAWWKNNSFCCFRFSVSFSHSEWEVPFLDDISSRFGSGCLLHVSLQLQTSLSLSLQIAPLGSAIAWQRLQTSILWKMFWIPGVPCQKPLSSWKREQMVLTAMCSMKSWKPFQLLLIGWRTVDCRSYSYVYFRYVLKFLTKY